MRRIWVSLILVLFSALSALPSLAQDTVTFNNQIVRILQENCQTCHRPGNIAPFPLLTYEDASSRARQILNAVQRRNMPPWPPSNMPGVFHGERILSTDQIQTIARWVEAGTPEGVPVDLPEPVTFPEGWSLGEPDLVAQPDEAFAPDPSRTDVHRCFVVNPGASRDLWLKGLEVQPGNRSIVHHVLLFVDDRGEGQRLDARDPGPGYSCFGGPGFTPDRGLGGWAPGLQPQFLPEGVGIRIPAGTTIVMQVHYNLLGHIHATGGDAHQPTSVEPDRTRLGLFLSDVPFERTLIYVPIANTRFEIPAGSARHEVSASFLVPVGARLYSIAPHMHLLGREMRVEAEFPNGERRNLIEIRDWDFNWQGSYFYKEPIALRPFTRIRMTAVYDNSADNPYNPSNPPTAVRWGERTTDEMCLVFLGVTLDNPALAGLFR